MNTNNILNALCDVKGLKSAEIMEETEDFIFTPWDWQGWMPGTPDEIDQAEWRVNATKQLAVNMDGLPRIF